MKYKQDDVANQKGITLIEALMSLAVIGLVSAGAFRISAERSTDIRDQQVAMEAKQVTDAAKRYVMDNFSTVQATATPTTPYILSTATLVGAGYLPSSFTGVNAYGQSYEVKVLEPTANNLEGLVVTFGGTAIDSKHTPAIAGLMGSVGGFIPYAGGAGNCNATTVACGAFGGWRIASTTNYFSAGQANPGGGHIAALVSLENGMVNDDYVYRNAVPGQPQLNQMNTPLIMNSVQASGAACATNGAIAQDGAGGVLVCDGANWKAQGGSLYWKDPVTNFASLPVCTAAMAGETHVAKTPSVGSGPRAYSCDGATWQALSLDDSGNLTIPGTASINNINVTGNSTLGNASTDTVTVNGTSTFNSGVTVGDGTAATAGNTLVVNRTAAEGGACSPNGAVARDATGMLLSCQSNVWRKGSKIATSSCAAGRAVTGFDAAGNPVCSTSAWPSSFTTNTSVSGGAAASAWYYCPAGYVVTGARVYTVMSSPMIDLYCSKP